MLIFVIVDIKLIFYLKKILCFFFILLLCYLVLILIVIDKISKLNYIYVVYLDDDEINLEIKYLEGIYIS